MITSVDISVLLDVFVSGAPHRSWHKDANSTFRHPLWGVRRGVMEGYLHVR